MSRRRFPPPPLIIPDGIPPALARSVPIGDDYVRCPASGIIHDDCFIQIRKGTRNLFARCSISRCGSMWYMPGSGWRDKYAKDGKIGFTMSEIRARFPGAMIL